MSHSAKLISSWCQGVEGLSKCVSAGQGVGGSPNMWSTRLTRQSCYHLSPVLGEPRPSHPGMCDFVGVGEGTRQWPGVAGIGGRLTSGICVVDSHHMLPVMPRRLDTHRSAWISQQPRQTAEFAPLQSVDRHSVWGMGVVVRRVRQPTLSVTPCICQLAMKPRR